MTQNARTNRKPREPNPPKLIAYAVSEAGRGRKIWTRLGGVWDHRNGEGMSVLLNVLPIDFDGRIVLLPPKPDEEEVSEEAAAAAGEAEYEEVGEGA